MKIYKNPDEVQQGYWASLQESKLLRRQRKGQLKKKQNKLKQCKRVWYQQDKQVMFDNFSLNTFLTKEC